MKNNLLFLTLCMVVLCTVLLRAYETPPLAIKHENAVDVSKIDTIYVLPPKNLFISEMERLDSYSNIELCDSVAYDFIVENGIQHPNIVLAQMRIESGNYQSKLAKKNNNYFGMRHPAQRLTVSLGQKNGYARYRNWAYSVIDYGLWQRRYANNLTEEEYLTKLSNTYAEDPDYVRKVKNIAKNLENAK